MTVVTLYQKQACNWGKKKLLSPQTNHRQERPIWKRSLGDCTGKGGKKTGNRRRGLRWAQHPEFQQAGSTRIARSRTEKSPASKLNEQELKAEF